MLLQSPSPLTCTSMVALGAARGLGMLIWSESRSRHRFDLPTWYCPHGQIPHWLPCSNVQSHVAKLSMRQTCHT